MVKRAEGEMEESQLDQAAPHERDVSRSSGEEELGVRQTPPKPSEVVLDISVAIAAFLAVALLAQFVAVAMHAS
jgi:hypothetical protein